MSATVSPNNGGVCGRDDSCMMMSGQPRFAGGLCVEIDL
jgi:hypothetical protein